MAEDGSFEMATVNERVFDQQTKSFVEVNDIRKGRYDVTCDVGPAFKNRQQESVKALQELSSVIPGLSEITADIQLKNIASPGVDLAAERVRRRLFQAGQIPETQMTDEEKEEVQQAQLAAQQNPPAPDPIQQAVLEQTQAQTADVVSKAQERADKTQLKLLEEQRKQDELALKTELAADKQDGEDAKILIEQQRLALDAQDQRFNQQQSINSQIIEMLNTQAETLKTLRDAMGIDTIVGPHNTQAYTNQAELVTQNQDQISATPEADKALGRDQV